MPGRLAQAGAPHVFGASEIVSCPVQNPKVQIGGQAVLQLAAFGLCLEVQKFKSTKGKKTRRLCPSDQPTAGAPSRFCPDSGG
jgi:hypothetical protein